ncbi:uncharacterized protein PG986_004985 [Apiospora aurea]|uniref:Uncharacterized protein n=1 Tax=Apiospora aurea TaxID=335848 RepID=A0ABR1QG91_9PEZI
MKTFDNKPWEACDPCVQRKRPCWSTQTETVTLKLVNIWLVLLDRPKDSESDDVDQWYLESIDSPEVQQKTIDYMGNTVAREYRDAYARFGGHDGAVKVVKSRILLQLDKEDFLRWATQMEGTAGRTRQAGQGDYQPLMQDALQSASNFPTGRELPTGAVDYSSGSTGAAPQAAANAWEAVADPWSLDSETVRKLVQDPVRVRWYLRWNLGKRQYNQVASDCDRCFLGQGDGCGRSIGGGACGICAEKAKGPEPALPATVLCTYDAVKAAKELRKVEPQFGEVENTQHQIARVDEKYREYNAQGDDMMVQAIKRQLGELDAKIAKFLSA